MCGGGAGVGYVSTTWDEQNTFPIQTNLAKQQQIKPIQVLKKLSLPKQDRAELFL